MSDIYSCLLTCFFGAVYLEMHSIITYHSYHHHRTAFQTKFGVIEYIFMPLSLINIPVIFQILIKVPFNKLQTIFYTLYLVDIVIYLPYTFENI